MGWEMYLTRSRGDLADGLAEMIEAGRRFETVRGRNPAILGWCSQAALAGRAETELLATGARPRRAALSSVESLTPSERRVARMAAEGPTNREIAQLLFVRFLRTEEQTRSVAPLSAAL